MSKIEIHVNRQEKLNKKKRTFCFSRKCPLEHLFLTSLYKEEELSKQGDSTEMNWTHDVCTGSCWLQLWSLGQTKTFPLLFRIPEFCALLPRSTFISPGLLPQAVKVRPHSLLLFLLSSQMSGSEYKGTLPWRSSSSRHVSVLASCSGFTALGSHPPSFSNSYSACQSCSLHHHLPRVPHVLLLMLVLESCVLFSLILFSFLCKAWSSPLSSRWSLGPHHTFTHISVKYSATIN